MIFELRSRTNYHSIPRQLKVERRFSGEAIGGKWQPIKTKFADKLSRRKVGDFTEWGTIPVFSHNAVSALGEVLKANGELLPIQCNGIPLWVFNVTRTADILDEVHSEIHRFSDGRFMAISRYEFDASRIPADLCVFKLPPKHWSRVYVTDIFVKAVEDAGLKGFQFEQLWPHEPKVQIGAPAPESLDELMRRDELDELEDDFDTELWELLRKRITTVESLQAWPEPVRVYYASRLLEWEVGNGGFAQAAMNIPEWFEEAAKGYEVLGKPKCAARIREAAEFAASEADALSEAGVSLESAFEYFDEAAFENFDSQLDKLGWWAEEDRIDFVRANRTAFNDAWNHD